MHSDLVRWGCCCCYHCQVHLSLLPLLPPHHPSHSLSSHSPPSSSSSSSSSSPADSHTPHSAKWPLLEIHAVVGAVAVSTVDLSSNWMMSLRMRAYLCLLPALNFPRVNVYINVIGVLSAALCCKAASFWDRIWMPMTMIMITESGITGSGSGKCSCGCCSCWWEEKAETTTTTTAAAGQECSVDISL